MTEIRHWIELATQKPAFTPAGDDPPILLYSPTLAADEDFPGHPYIVSNPEYAANGNAGRDGFTHWCVIQPFDGRVDRGS